MADFRVYMSPDEFAGLPSDVHHAVWRAATEGRIDCVPVLPGSPSAARLYRREQVQAIAASLTVAVVPG